MLGFESQKGIYSKKWRKKKGDGLNSLADDLLISILCHVDGKTAVQTSVLSKRWKNLWAKVPVLDFKHLEVFRNEDDQNRFLENYLTRRDNLIELKTLFSIHTFCGRGLATSDNFICNSA